MAASEKDGNSGEWRASRQAKPGEAPYNIEARRLYCGLASD